MKKYIINDKELNFKELAEYLGITRQGLYNRMKKFTIEEIVKMDKNEILKTKTSDELNYYKNIINKTNVLLDNYIKNWYKGDFCLKDLEYIKESLNTKEL